MSDGSVHDHIMFECLADGPVSHVLVHSDHFGDADRAGEKWGVDLPRKGQRRLALGVDCFIGSSSRGEAKFVADDVCE